MQEIHCAEIWGGISNFDTDLCTSGLTASLSSTSAEGGKGGDIYYFSVCGADMLTRIAIADVMGHGQEVSRISEWLYASLSTRMNCTKGHDILSELNGLAQERGFQAMTTAAIVAFYLHDSNLYFSYAGHPPMLVRRRATKEWVPVRLHTSPQVANLPLGVQPDVPYHQEQTPLSSGDRLFIYTDGVIEAPNSAGKLFGQRGLLDVLREAGSDSLMDLKTAVLGALRNHTGGSLAHDDVTLMAVEIR